MTKRNGAFFWEVEKTKTAPPPTHTNFHTPNHTPRVVHHQGHAAASDEVRVHSTSFLNTPQLRLGAYPIPSIEDAIDESNGTPAILSYFSSTPILCARSGWSSFAGFGCVLPLPYCGGMCQTPR